MGESERLDRIGVAALLELENELGHGLVLGVEVEQDRHIAKLERRIDECDLLAQFRSSRHGQVYGDSRPTDAALRAEDGHDPALRGWILGARCRRGVDWPSRARGR